jgi:hypothetical protein
LRDFLGLRARSADSTTITLLLDKAGFAVLLAWVYYPKPGDVMAVVVCNVRRADAALIEKFAGCDMRARLAEKGFVYIDEPPGA